MEYAFHEATDAFTLAASEYILFPSLRMKVSAILVNYNTGDVIGNAIDSVCKQTGISFEILVVDNASPDKSAARLRERSCPCLTVIENAENIGFGPANNVGARHAQGEYLLMLNPDACFRTTNDLSRLANWMDRHPECGLCGATILHNGQRTGPKMDYPGRKKIQNEWNLPAGPAWVAGAFMFVRKTAFDQIGGFDEDFFLYAEEIDLGLRMRKAGHTVGFVSEVEIHHIGGVSEIQSDRYDYWRRRTAGRYLFLTKHYSPEVCRRQFLKEKRRAALRIKLYSLLPGRSKKKTLYRAIYDATNAALAALK